ncbi:MAG: NifB/NifX family molybdenum-iron cluster-binding protein [Piscinibacter sp.]|uniref:NifB/NifX family molybdenum-iron cluster-binding protein n=1 Tax=Piscinibacter sp. TaxID=1903157 RepID=UPI003D12C3C2
MTLLALTTQNRRDISEHAGRCRRFLVTRLDDTGQPGPWQPIELALTDTLHEVHDGLPAPLAGVDVLITRGAGPGLARRLARSGVQVLLTTHTEPAAALQAWRAGELAPAPQVAAEGGCGHEGCGCHH